MLNAADGLAAPTTGSQGIVDGWSAAVNAARIPAEPVLRSIERRADVDLPAVLAQLRFRRVHIIHGSLNPRNHVDGNVISNAATDPLGAVV